MLNNLRTSSKQSFILHPNVARRVVPTESGIYISKAVPPLSSCFRGNMATMEDYKYLFKVVLVGNAGVGKTCLVRRFTQGMFPPGQGATIGVDFMIKTVEVEGEKIKVSLNSRKVSNNQMRGIGNYCQCVFYVVACFREYNTRLGL